ncbi:hypothetical protein FJZ26_05780, partial [Candidatus Parvarchaeota archaeon]|nr:hypothetical protein [Candidatus Parvarchaeota archaeon]
NKACSACELVFGLLGANNIEKMSALCLLCGIVSDSYYFRSASAKTFHITSSLLKKSGLTYPQILGFVEQPKDLAHRMSVLEACREAQIIRIAPAANRLGQNDFLIALSQSASFEAEAATALIFLGADVAVVGHAGKNLARISARMKNAYAGSLDMSKIMAKAARLIGGSGGGHICAAGAHGTRPQGLVDALNLAEKLVRAKVEKRAKAQEAEGKK